MTYICKLGLKPVHYLPVGFKLGSKIKEKPVAEKVASISNKVIDLVQGLRLQVLWKYCSFCIEFRSLSIDKWIQEIVVGKFVSIPKVIKVDLTWKQIFVSFSRCVDNRSSLTWMCAIWYNLLSFMCSGFDVC